MTAIPVGTAVDVEQTRLTSLVELVFGAGAHYSHDCHCESCSEVRKRLSTRDQEFIDKVSMAVTSSVPEELKAADGD